MCNVRNLLNCEQLITSNKANNQPDMVEGQPQIEEDWEVLAKATNAANGVKFQRLWSGDWRTDYSHKANAAGTASSEADSALICFLAFHTKNRAQIARMFMKSALGKRDKYSKASTHRSNYLINGMIDYALNNPDVIPAADFSEALKKFSR
jgi:primase-polymerase (primpol)-like protein